MWYVLQVPTGREDRLIEEIRSYRIQEYFEEVFAPRSVRKKKYRGKWQTSEELLFPGYLFVISENPEELYQAIVDIYVYFLHYGENKTIEPAAEAVQDGVE